MRQRAIHGLLAATLLLGPAGPTRAFQEAGHFYTAYALVQTGSQKELTLISLCAQLPDMASDIDAVAVYKSAALGSPLSWWRWATADAVDSEDTRRMVTIQQVLHALTGGARDAVERVARASVAELMVSLRRSRPAPTGVVDTLSEASAAKERATALCALGFAFHFYGDSVAHRQLDKPTKMYTTGKGHAGDLSYPDFPMCDGPANWMSTQDHCTPYKPGSQQRFAAWMDMWGHAEDLLDISKVDDNVRKSREDKLKELIKISGEASDSNGWLEERMRLALGGGSRSDDPVNLYSAFIKSQKSDRKCELVLEDAFKKLPHIGVFSKLTCADVWTLYSGVVRKALNAEPDARAPLGERRGKDIDAVYLDMPMMKK